MSKIAQRLLVLFLLAILTGCVNNARDQAKLQLEVNEWVPHGTSVVEAERIMRAKKYSVEREPARTQNSLYRGFDTLEARRMKGSWFPRPFRVVFRIEGEHVTERRVFVHGVTMP